MRIHHNGKRTYFACSDLVMGACKVGNTQYYRTDRIEQAILPRIAAEVVPDAPVEDGAEKIRRRIAAAQTEAAKIETAYERAMLRTGALAEQTAAKLERDHAAKLRDIVKLEAELATIENVRPSGELQGQVQSALDRALAGDVVARGVIADALPGLIGKLRCLCDGRVQIESKGIKLRWTVVVNAGKQPNELKRIAAVGFYSAEWHASPVPDRATDPAWRRITH